MSQTNSKDVKIRDKDSGKATSTQKQNLKKTQYGSNRGPYLHKTIHNQDVPSAISNSQESADEQTAEGSHLTDGSYGVDKTRITVELLPESIHIPSFLGRLLKPTKFGTPSKGIVAMDNFPAIYIKWNWQINRLALEFNPSDFTRNEGLELCPFAMLGPLCELVIRRVLTEGDPDARPVFAIGKSRSRYDFAPSWESQVQVSRLDLARDFQITDSRFSLEQLAHRYPSRSRHQAATHFRNDGRLNTLTYPVSDRTARIKFYNKYEERKRKPLKDAPPIREGVFRFEVSYTRHALRKIHIPTLDLMTPPRLEKMIRSKWLTSNYWVNLIWEGESARMLLAKEGYPESALIIFYMHCVGVGIVPVITREKLSAIKRKLKNLGLSTKLPIHKQGQFYGHLDFISGDIAKPLPPEFSITKDDLFGTIEDRTI